MTGSLRILVVGKDNVMKWPQAVYRHLPVAEKELFIYNRTSVFGSFLRLFGKKYKTRYAAKCLKKRIKAFKPDVILYVGAFLLPTELFLAAKEFPSVKKAAWAGDSWKHKNITDVKNASSVLDVLFITASDYESEVTALDFQGKVFFAPLCVDTGIFKKSDVKRTGKPFFVGVSNPEREELFAACETPCVIYGKGWDTDKLKQHEVHNQRLTPQEAQEFIVSSVVPININETPNGNTGINFRTFEIPACGGLIITNPREDLARSYDIGTEAVVYRSPEEFNALIKDVVANPEKYEAIARKGYEKTMVCHTYEARLREICAHLESLS